MHICIFSTFNHPLLSLFLDKYNLKKHNVKIIIDNYDDKETVNTFNFRTKKNLKYKLIHQLKNKYPFYFFENHNSSILTNFIKKEKTDLIVNLGTPRILKKNILKAAHIGILNCHPGILPYYRGCNCVEWALYNNDRLGNTCHLMTEKIDEGPIIFKKFTSYNKADKYYDIRIKSYLEALYCIDKSIKILSLSKNLNNFEYPTNGTYWQKMNKKDFKKILIDYKYY